MFNWTDSDARWSWSNAALACRLHELSQKSKTELTTPWASIHALGSYDRAFGDDGASRWHWGTTIIRSGTIERVPNGACLSRSQAFPSYFSLLTSHAVVSP